MTVKYICIVGRRNQPVYASAINSADDAGMALLAFASLDMVEERCEQLRRTSNAAAYLGRILIDEDLHVYAHVTATAAKIIVICDDRDPELVKDLLLTLHLLYAAAVQNPFQIPDTELSSPGFKVRVEKLLSKA
jgi:hypothetical protein